MFFMIFDTHKSHCFNFFSFIPELRNSEFDHSFLLITNNFFANFLRSCFLYLYTRVVREISLLLSIFNFNFINKLIFPTCALFFHRHFSNQAGWQAPKQGWNSIPRDWTFTRLTGLVKNDRSAELRAVYFVPEQYRWFKMHSKIC